MNHYVDDLAALTEHLNLKNAIRVGHSTGGGEVTIRDAGVLNAVWAATSACHQRTSYVLLSTDSVIENLSGAS